VNRRVCVRPTTGTAVNCFTILYLNDRRDTLQNWGAYKATELNWTELNWNASSVALHGELIGTELQYVNAVQIISFQFSLRSWCNGVLASSVQFITVSLYTPKMCITITWGVDDGRQSPENPLTERVGSLAAGRLVDLCPNETSLVRAKNVDERTNNDR